LGIVPVTWGDSHSIYVPLRSIDCWLWD
jgi:hypothetical protein